MNEGFRVFAEDLAQYTEEYEEVTLKWSSKVFEAPSLKHALSITSRRPHTHPENIEFISEDDLRTIGFEIDVDYDPERSELVVSKLGVGGLWDGFQLEVLYRGEDYEGIQGHQPRSPITLPNHEILWKEEASNEEYNFLDFMRSSHLSGILEQESEPWGEIEETEELTWVLQQFVQAITRELPSVNYIGPTRVVDDREYAVGESQSASGVGRSGERTWVRLRQLENASDSIQSWFSDHLKSVVKITGVERDRETPTRPRVSAKIGDLELPLHDFGLGTSQALPILVQLALNLRLTRHRGPFRGSLSPHENRILLVEEPESHLHPAAQKALAFAFIDFVQEGGFALVETHSEVFLRAVELAISKGSLEPTEATVNWVDYRPPELRGPELSRMEAHGFSEEGDLVGEIPSTFDQVVSELIEERIFGGS